MKRFDEVDRLYALLVFLVLAATVGMYVAIAALAV